MGDRPPSRQFGRAVALAGGVLLWYSLIATTSSLWDRDEPRFARAAVEMMQTGNWLVPTFNGEPRLHKPVLVYWFMTVPLRVFGETELGARAVAPLSSALACFFTFLIGRRLFDARRALLAAAMMAATPLLLVSGTAATTDALLLAWITGGFAIIVTAPEGSLSWWRSVLLGVTIGGALLTKGPVGPMVVLLCVVAASVLERGDPLISGREWLRLAAAFALGLGMLLLWGVPANRATGGKFASQGIGHHVLARSFQPFEGHGGDLLLFLPYYLVVILLAFFPWTLFLPTAASRVWRAEGIGRRERAILIGWAIPTLIVMTLVVTKLPHYALPVWPALALAVAGTIDVEQPGETATSGRLTGRILFAIGGTLLSAVFMIGPFFVELPGAEGPLFSLGALLMAVTVVGLVSSVRQGTRFTVWLLLAGAMLVQATLGFSVVPAIERLKLTPRIVHTILNRTPAGAPVAAAGYTEPSLVFYLNRGRVEMLSGTEEIGRWAGSSGPGVLIIDSEEFENAKLVESLDLEPLEEIEGMNFVHGDWERVRILGRDLALPGGERRPRAVQE